MITFLVPIYPPHFKFAKKLIKSFNEQGLNSQADLWFIFTNEEEKAEFDECKNSIILPEHLRNFENRGIINIKKFYGLTQIKDQYEYVIVLDSETLFIKNIDLKQVCDSYFNNKILYGNLTRTHKPNTVEMIQESCLKHFSESVDKSKINDDFYLWFNQPCIYKSSTLDEFFDVINYKENASKYTWYDFDYYIYMYYLMLYQDFKIEDIEIKSNYGVFESTEEYLEYTGNKYEKIPIYMCSRILQEKFDNENLFIICHADRDIVRMMQLLNGKISRQSRRITMLENELINERKRRRLSYKLRRFLSFFVWDKELRKKIRGDI